MLFDPNHVVLCQLTSNQGKEKENAVLKRGKKNNQHNNNKNNTKNKKKGTKILILALSKRNTIPIFRYIFFHFIIIFAVTMDDNVTLSYAESDEDIARRGGGERGEVEGEEYDSDDDENSSIYYDGPQIRLHRDLRLFRCKRHSVSAITAAVRQNELPLAEYIVKTTKECADIDFEVQ